MANFEGAVRSNSFKVLDVKAFLDWFYENAYFGDGLEVYIANGKDEEDVDGEEVGRADNKPGEITFGSTCDGPCAFPMKPIFDEDGDFEDTEEWDLEEFATEIRKHLQPGEEFRVIAAGAEKLRYVCADHLVVTDEKVTFTSLCEG